MNRKEVFLTTKVLPSAMRNGMVRLLLDQSIEQLDRGYIDLVFIHWPAENRYNKETWKILEEYVDKGKIRSISLSNFSLAQVQEVLEYARIMPVLNPD